MKLLSQIGQLGAKSAQIIELRPTFGPVGIRRPVAQFFKGGESRFRGVIAFTTLVSSSAFPLYGLAVQPPQIDEGMKIRRHPICLQLGGPDVSLDEVVTTCNRSDGRLTHRQFGRVGERKHSRIEGVPFRNEDDVGVCVSQISVAQVQFCKHFSGELRVGRRAYANMNRSQP